MAVGQLVLVASMAVQQLVLVAVLEVGQLVPVAVLNPGADEALPSPKASQSAWASSVVALAAPALSPPVSTSAAAS